MAGYTLDDYTYKEKLRLYNDENRENVGMNIVFTADSDYYWDTTGATLNLYTIDVTTPSTEPMRVCSFKDGHTYQLTWNSFDFNYSDDRYSASLTINVYDKDGNIVPGKGMQQTVFWDKMYNSPGTTQFYFNPPNFEYSLGSSDHPVNYHNGGSIITVGNRPIGAIIRDMPDIRNAVTKMNGLNGGSQWWQRFDYEIDSSDFESFMNSLGPDPTPKKPEDDTNDKPEPKPDPDYPDPSDPVPDPDVPEGGDAIATGLINVYAPTANQLRNLAIKLWDDDPTAFHDVITKIQNDPMEAIISVHTVPYQLTGTSKNCVIGNYDSGISMPAIDHQWYKINLGSLYLPEKWGSALDYAPYNDIQIFLPYIGIRAIQIDDVVGKTISVKYNTDVLTGCTVAHIMCGDSVLYTYNTVISSEVPLSMSSYAPLYRTVANGIANVASQAAAGNAAGMVGAAAGAAINVALSKQTNISRSGSIGSCFGSMSHFYPYLIIHRPIQSLASGFRHFKGYPSNITTNLGSISGYTEIESIHLDGIKCTEAERDEIRALLYNGVIF